MSYRIIQFAGSVVAVEACDAASDKLLDFLLLNIPTTEDSHPHITLLLVFDPSRQEYCLVIPGAREFRSKSPAVIGTFLMDRAGYHLADRSQGGLLLHAACMGFQGKGLLLVGGTGVGKSSLAAWLAWQGCDYLTDELSYIPYQGSHCQGFARPINLKAGSRLILKEALAAAAQSGLLLSSDHSDLLQPQGMGSTVVPEVSLSAIFILRYQPQQELSFIKLSQAQAGFELMQRLINAQNLPEHGFRQVIRLVLHIPVYRLKYGSFESVFENLITQIE